MSIFIECLFRFLAYCAFGFVMEVIFSAITRALNKDLPKIERIQMQGETYIWMIPVYGFGLLFPFELLHSVLPCGSWVSALSMGMLWVIFIRYIIWCLLITAVEVLFGWVYDKVLGVCPWDYKQKGFKDIIFDGYSAWRLIPMWGICGLVLELYTNLLIYLSPFISSY